MAEVDVEISNFKCPACSINRSLTLDVPLSHLVWGAITVGAPNSCAALIDGLSGLAFTAHKALAICATLRSDGTRFVHPANFRTLDQSEKVSLSYWLGMAMAKVIAWRVLGVAWLSHARHLKRQDILQVMPSNTRILPDLVGQDQMGGWHVIEAKARQASASQDERTHWKTQASVVRNIEGVPADSRSYCLTLQEPVVKVDLVDPEPMGEHIDLEVDVESLLQNYYWPYHELFLAEGAEYDEDRGKDLFFATILTELHTGQRLQLGLPRRVIQSEFHDLPKRPITAYLDDGRRFYQGPDHIAVRLAHGERPKDYKSDY